MQHFFVKPENFQGDRVEITEPPILHQMMRVLRMQKGDEAMVLDNSGDEFFCRLEFLSEQKAELRILEKRKNTAEPEIFVTLYQALPKKPELFEWVLQKGTEIGVSRFVPLITERTERTNVPKPERLEKILKEAAEQSERGKIPELGEIQKFPAAFTHTTGRQKILLHGRGKYPLLSKIVAKQGPIDILVGPEGGFMESEIDQAEKSGFTIASLGMRVLRTETAGIVAAALILYNR